MKKGKPQEKATKTHLIGRNPGGLWGKGDWELSIEGQVGALQRGMCLEVPWSV